ncbi:MAG TPA: glycosyltransferase family 2 protein [Alphaproteobacteria bacterium]|nr:glycosyltransferase family 2 protein [Alphaproteobacteria bacterium]
MKSLTTKDKEYFKGKTIMIAMPTYNEEKNIGIVVRDAFNVLKKITPNHGVLVFNDGSTDSTGKVLENLKKKYSKLKVIHIPKNKGVGNANNVIYKSVKGDILFWNASDNQIHMDEIFTMLPHIKDNDIVVGNRVHRADNWLRRLMSGCFSLALRIRFGLPVKDIDSVKIFRIDVFKKIKPESKTAFIETEILIRAKKKGLRIIEVPIKHYPRLSGKAQGVRLRIIIPQLKQMFKAIFTRW